MKTFIETPRLLLRDWQESDLPAFARLNADPQVMEYFPQCLDETETHAFYQRIRTEFDTCGYGLYALEHKETHEFIGFTGLHRFTFEADFAPGIEIGWRLRHDYWGHGYAPEAATACLQYARTQLHLQEVFSFTAAVNKRSERVMQKIGMQPVKMFGHPLVPASHPLHLHVLYKITL